MRKLGWNAVPSNTYSVRSEGETVSLKGKGAGHGVGLCQQGAAGLAGQGMDFTEILRHYFPDTTIEAKPSSVVRQADCNLLRAAALPLLQ